MTQKLIMRDEVLHDGTPVALTDLLEKHDGRALWSSTTQSMRQILTDYLPEIEVVMPSLWEGESAKLERVKQLNAVAVSLDAYDTTGAYALGVSRHFAKGGQRQLRIGERPGSAPLHEQIETLQTHVAGRGIVLLEDDMPAEGGTAQYVIEQLQKTSIRVIECIPSTQASEVTEIAGVPVRPIERLPQESVFDVVHPRDFLFGLRDAGLVISDHGLLYRAPLLSLWVDLTARARASVEQARQISQAMAELNLKLYAGLNTLVGRDICVSDTAATFQTFVKHETDYHPDGTMIGFCEYVIEAGQQ